MKKDTLVVTGILIVAALVLGYFSYPLVNKKSAEQGSTSGTQPVFTLTPIPNDDGYSIKSIDVYADGKLLQTISNSNVKGGVAELYGDVDPQTLVSFEDINFDGYNDIKVQQGMGATGNVYFEYYLYDPASARFGSQPGFGILNPVLQPEQKRISSYATQGCAGNCFERDIYYVKNGQFVLTNRETHYMDAQQNLWVKVEELKNGSLKVIKEEKTNPDIL